MEERRLLDADPIRIGVTYLEDDSGHDAHGDMLQIAFEGGAPGTELTHLVIDGDHYAPGLSFGDMIFDTVNGGLGADGAFPLQVLSSSGIGNVSWHVEDGSSLLTFDFQGFNAGEKLIFTVDVDEMQDFTPGTTDINTINQGMDPIASGVEFQGSHLTAAFQHARQAPPGDFFLAISLGDRNSATHPKGFARHFKPRGSLPTLVFVEINQAHDPAHRDLCVVRGSDGEYSRYYQIPRTSDDLLRRSALIELATAEGATLVVLIKEIGTDALFGLIRVSAHTRRDWSRAARTKEVKSGCGSNGFDLSSGWNCTPMNQG
jgi:hypothetical protein